MAHASWKGFVRLSLVSVPVQAFNAESPSGGDIRFNQLHDPCKSRIKYVKTCPIHGEVANNEIVKGYEYAKGEYVIVDDDEFAGLRGKADQAIDIDTFVKPGSIDPKYFDGRTYYLVPDGPVARKPYAVLLAALSAKGLWGVATASFLHRDHLAVLRAIENALCIETLHYAAELRDAADVGGDLELPKVPREEARLAGMLIDASTAKKFDMARYKDETNDKLRELLEAKIEGRQIVAPPQVEMAPTINLIDALRKSVKQEKGGPMRRAAKAADQRATASRRGRRKSAG